MILEVLLFCLCEVIAINSQDAACSISMFTRKRCKINEVIADSAVCLKLGCCYDQTQEIPTLGRCYRKGKSLQYEGFRFSPTISPTWNGQSVSGVLTVGGEAGFPGSQLMLQCDQSIPCQISGSYQDERSSCTRRGCCWSSGRCYQQKWRILRLRSKCPPGFKGPPACNDVINPCEDQPCKNGGVCSFISPGKFTCDCKTGFSGTLCEANCKRSELAVAKGKVIPDHMEYIDGEQVMLECDPDHTHQVGAQVSRRCINSEFSPPLATHPFICSSACEVPNVDFSTRNPPQIQQINHGTSVVYTCDYNRYTLEGQPTFTRTCDDGTLKPGADICSSRCEVPQVSSAIGTPPYGSKLKHFESVSYECATNHRTDARQLTFMSRCEDGTFNPPVLVCRKPCTPAKPMKNADHSLPSGQVVKHLDTLTYTCHQNHKTSDNKNSFTATCYDGTLVGIGCQM